MTSSQLANQRNCVCGGVDEGMERCEGVADDKPLQHDSSDCLNASHRSCSSQPQVGLQKSHRSRKFLSLGEWRSLAPELCPGGLVYLTQQKGKHWAVHGHTHQGSTVLVPEEALFLVECGVLEVSCEGKVWDLQEAYCCLLSNIPLPTYQVYASLKRVGFIANRVCLLSRQHGGDPLKPDAEPHLLLARVCPLCSDRHTGLTTGATRMCDMLEVYKPPGTHSTPYKKSESKPPHFRVLVARMDEQFPSQERLQQLHAIKPEAPLRVCVVDGGNLAYYTIHFNKS